MKTMMRDGYPLSYTQMENPDMPPVMVIGSAIYYPRLFQDPIFQNLNLIFIDHRGFSRSSNPDASFQLSDIVQDIECILRELKLDKIYLLGHSGHGFMAMAYAEQYPEHVMGMIL